MTTIGEQIIDKVISAIDGTGDFEQVVRSSRTTANVDVFPSVVVRVLAEEKRQHLRLAVERVMNIEAEVVDADYDDEARASGVGQLVGAVEDAILGNETWDGLAVGTEILDSAPEFGEGLSPRGTDRVRFSVLYRTVLDDSEAIQNVNGV